MNSRSLRCLTLLGTTALLAACEPAPDDGTEPAPASASEVASAVAAAATAAASTHPLCDLVSYDEVRGVVGGNISRLDVIDDPASPHVDCIYLDPSDHYNGLTLRFTPSARLVAAGSPWTSVSAYVEEWARSGDPVPALGDAAAWVEFPPGLLLRKGDFALHLGASRADLTQVEVRARFETLARQVITRLP